MTADETAKIKAHCPRCDREQNCAIHGAFDQPWEYSDGEHHVMGQQDHKLLQCRGCDLDGDIVTIRAEKKVEREEDGDRRRISKRAYGTFSRSLRLPYPVDADAVKAHFDRGVLTITLPRNGEAERGRRIAIESSPAPALESQAASEARH